MFGRNYKKRDFKQVTDGLSNTFLLGEVLPENCVYQGQWAPNFSMAGTSQPLNSFVEPKCDPAAAACHTTKCGFTSAHPGGAHFAMVDASVHFINDTIDHVLYNNLGTRAGEEAASLR
jgi:prepilin-type processing-associated H-X9-DG protein